MDWQYCLKKRIAKEIKEDKNLIISLLNISETKIKSVEALSEEFFVSKISLLYDALREILEAIAIKKGYKIYNHECYTSFIKEILNLSREADIFDNLRKIRNSINYYGKEIEKYEAEELIKSLKEQINIFKKFIQF
ncbi:MAG: hypothetical protein QW757_02965 [Candidatus Woesearchaeota archaeon]